METLRSVIRFVKPRDWMASIELKDTYLHIPICPSHHKYCYQFGVVPFGLNTAPMVWTKVLAPIMEILHLRGIYISKYLDNLITKAAAHSCVPSLGTLYSRLAQSRLCDQHKKV